MTGRRRTQRILALALAAGLAVLVLPATQAEASGGHHLRARIDRLTSAIYQGPRPPVQDGTAPTVDVYVTIYGCVPGEDLEAHLTMWQDGTRLINTAGWSPGSGQFTCGPDGTVAFREAQLGLDEAAGVPHPGRAWATLTVWAAGVPVQLASRKVVVPGPCHHHRARGHEARV